MPHDDTTKEEKQIDFNIWYALILSSISSLQLILSDFKFIKIVIDNQISAQLCIYRRGKQVLKR